MKTTVPTALYIDERTKTNLTSYVSGKTNSTFVSGEAGYNRMHVTCPFPGDEVGFRFKRCLRKKKPFPLGDGRSLN